METIGQILKNAREKKGLTIEELEAATRIVAKFIKALENEEFDVLPGEIYVKGFIKNLSDKLSLDADMVLERYNLQKNGTQSEQDFIKNAKGIKAVKKNKEQANYNKDNKDNKEQSSTKEAVKETNTKENTKKDAVNTKKDEEKTIKETNKKNKNININNNAEADLLFMARRDLSKLRNKNKSVMPSIITILAVIVVIAVIAFNWKNILGLFSSGSKKQNRNKAEISKNIVDSKARLSVKSGDIIYFKPLGISAAIKFNSIGNVLHININGQDLSFSKSSPIIADLNGNGINDFRISVIEVYDNSATVEMERLEENQMVNTEYNDINAAELNNTNYNNTVSTNLLVINDETYIEQDTEKVDIRIEITAKHFVYIRYFIDSNRPATTNLLSGKTLYLEAKDVVMLTIGNAGEVAVKVNGKLINAGDAGETVNKTIKWVKNLNDSTRYNLIMLDTK
ncbi:helix-turn-helix domain-containing protein [uncultured Brachyspira sp.]|uniref:helix-turn-helix domain-containing protein n=1 Tax=uncultured Brachyspira sp. TaxID=221953 RepID=UPI0025D8ED03|nr:helix-turn-helix domain-containing protein [uncultured Brachyspira sp.]